MTIEEIRTLRNDPEIRKNQKLDDARALLAYRR